MMSGDLEWTDGLGEAVAADQTEVMDAVQSFRRKAEGAGNLKTDDKQIVAVEEDVVKIVQADPQIIYVPQYEPQVVVVQQTAPVYPTYYPTPYPVYYYPYPPGYSFAAGVFWGATLAYAFDWHGGTSTTTSTSTSTAIPISTGTPISIATKSTLAPPTSTVASRSRWRRRIAVPGNQGRARAMCVRAGTTGFYAADTLVPGPTAGTRPTTGRRRSAHRRPTAANDASAAAVSGDRRHGTHPRLAGSTTARIAAPPAEQQRAI